MKDLNFNDDAFEVIVTTKDSQHKANWQHLFSNKPFVIAFQPGAGNPAYEVNRDMWMEKGLGGCTNEAFELGNSLNKFAEHNIDVFIVNSLDPKLQPSIIKDKKFNGNLKFLADPDLDLAQLMGVEYLHVNETYVHKPTIGVYNNSGKCVETIYPEKQDCELAQRPSASKVLQSAKQALNLIPIILEPTDHTMPSAAMKM